MLACFDPVDYLCFKQSLLNVSSIRHRKCTGAMLVFGPYTNSAVMCRPARYSAAERTNSPFDMLFAQFILRTSPVLE